MHTFTFSVSFKFYRKTVTKQHMKMNQYCEQNAIIQAESFKQ